ncbi:glycosyltransferase [Synechococcus sp. CS-1327]|uniref:glycosyltransferase n=1 Tax=Synechococcus sp. CS-1327 TaxID=2847977 RepID=UPI00223AE2A7|nr:glycosyltransferase [Synechococcus sp. CS-1327]MCT0232989.1 glycosyltransferase [Synechococcus sp. CS-1327]
MALSSHSIAAPTILLIVPTLNSFHLLPRLVASLRQQSWQHWRVLFIDGGSEAEHRAYLVDLCAGDARFRWVPQDPTAIGIFGAMNQGFAAAEPADWLLFWGSDDWAGSSTAFEQAVAAISSDPCCDLLLSRGLYLSLAADGRVSPRPRRRTAFLWLGSYRPSLLLGSSPPHQATLIGPGARQELASFAAGFRLAADLDYFLQLSIDPRLRVKRIPLEFVHIGDGGISGLQHRRRLQEVRWAYRRAFGGMWWLPFLLRYVQRGLSLLV